MNIKEQHYGVNKVYNHHARTPYKFFKQSNLFDSLSQSLYNLRRKILICQHYILFLTNFVFVSLFVLAALVLSLFFSV